MFPGFGTLVNSFLVLMGSSLGIQLSKFIPARVKKAIMWGIGLFTLLIGIKLISENKPELLKVFLLILLGSFLGSLLSLEKRLEDLTKNTGEFSKGFISASLLFTIGPMTLMGCILEGAKGDSSLILSKAFMDGFSSIILSSSLGKGVILSSLYILLFQGTITLLAYLYGDFLKEQSISNTLFIGGGLLVLSSLKILGMIKELKILDLMPSLLFALFF